jgi:hypothetical protein
MCWLFFGVIDAAFRRLPSIGLCLIWSIIELSVDATPYRCLLNQNLAVVYICSATSRCSCSIIWSILALARTRSRASCRIAESDTAEERRFLMSRLLMGVSGQKYMLFRPI